MVQRILWAGSLAICVRPGCRGETRGDCHRLPSIAGAGLLQPKCGQAKDRRSNQSTRRTVALTWRSQIMVRDFQQVLAIGLSLVLITTSSYGYRNPDSVSDAGAGGATDGAPMSPSELDA